MRRVVGLLVDIGVAVVLGPPFTLIALLALRDLRRGRP